MNPHTRTPSDAMHDFDFLIGTWTSRQRRLRKRLQGCEEWESFEALSTVQQLPGGLVNVDTLVAESWRPGWVGMTLRVYNVATDRWSIHWVTNEGAGIDAASGRLEAPVVGRFQGDEGVFEGEDLFEGRPIHVRFLWQRLGPDRARWQQAFSDDGGQAWEVNWVMEFERRAAPPARPLTEPALDVDCQVVELRRYTLHPGRRDALIDLFDRAFVETQEALGISVMGQFRDPDAPDLFLWLRGFADMDARARQLASFYGGPVWQQHRDAANATMIDSDDVLLLRPAWPGAGVAMRGRRRAAGEVRMAPAGLLDLSLFRLREPATPALLRVCQDLMTPCLQRAGARVLGWYVSDDTPNNYPRLPVRVGEHHLMGLALFDDCAAFEAFTRGGTWAREVAPALSSWLEGPVRGHRLVATARSAIHA